MAESKMSYAYEHTDGKKELCGLRLVIQNITDDGLFGNNHDIFSPFLFELVCNPKKSDCLCLLYPKKAQLSIFPEIFSKKIPEFSCNLPKYHL